MKNNAIASKRNSIVTSSKKTAQKTDGNSENGSGRPYSSDNDSSPPPRP